MCVIMDAAILAVNLYGADNAIYFGYFFRSFFTARLTHTHTHTHARARLRTYACPRTHSHAHARARTSAQGHACRLWARANRTHDCKANGIVVKSSYTHHKTIL